MVTVRLLQWLDNAPPPARAGAVAPLVNSYMHQALSPAARETLDVAMTLLLDDPAPEVRRALAEALAIHETAPRHLIVALAHDLPSVAEPVLRRSPCLLDPELVEAVRGGSVRAQVAVASRPWVGFAVSDIIAAEADGRAVLALLRNDGADLSYEAFATAAERFGDDPDVRAVLFGRPDLPIAVRQSVIARLGTALNGLMVARDWIAGDRAKSIVREACEKATVVLAAEAGEEELEDLVEHLRTTGQLTPALILRSACTGNIRFLEAALARLTGLAGDRVYAILIDGRQSAVLALFARAGLPERCRGALYAALEAWRELVAEETVVEGPTFARRMVERVLTRYRSFKDDEVDDLLALLRRLAAEAARDAARARAAEMMDEAVARMPDVDMAA
ncbi:DUF2336 domain-containing protein [Chthonobacter rhizosphaerae]|uniref:DUF2336 domain-containing protein n=1 Tax=Chthonobacter rhizosphaerae TaxID=2735553 RepID=UPI0015EE5BF8|nr:DUF2336 domain-containing protein [Chthonobacter rhizosphaerae]